jgi:hypothetical protein
VNRHYAFVAERAAHRCEYCRAPESIFNFLLEVEHIVPRSQGGRDEDTNLALACRACNLLKGDHLTGEDDITGEFVRLFHPRKDVWEEHFYFDGDTGMIQGRTPTGRATISCLRLNQPSQLAARRLWIQLELFP